MPEYSSTTITPADGVQVPSMNGSTSGNFLLSALRDYILASKGQANGLASLGSDGKLTPSQLPDLADDVIVVASYAVLPATGTAGKIYITADNNKMYRWDADLSTPDYVELSVDLSEYATLDDLAAEESARETADANLNDAITQLDHRVQNIEQSKGDYVVSTYKDGAITPSGKGDWAIVEGLRGVSRVENQIINITGGSASTINQVTFTPNADGTVTVNGTATGGDATYQIAPITNGHTYVWGGCPSGGSTSTYYFGTSASYADIGAGAYRAFSSGSYSLSIVVKEGTTINKTFAPYLTDLTVYFNGTIPSDADTIAEIQTNYPHLLQPSEYGTRLVDSSYGGVRAWARNLFNGVWEDGYLNSSNGSITYSTGYLTTDYIPVLPSTLFHIKLIQTSYDSVNVAYYDYNKNFLKFIGSAFSGENNSFTPYANAYYMRITITKASTSSEGFCVNKSDSLDGTFTPYHAPSTLSLTFQGKSAGAVAEMYYPETGECTKPLGSVDLGTLTWIYDGTRFWATIPDYRSSSVNLLCGIYMAGVLYSDKDKEIYPGNFHNSGEVNICDSSYTSVGSASDPSSFLGHLQGVVLYYELATPNPSTFVTPIIDNTLLTEAGGRMATVQTGTVVDGSFDMGFITL